MSKKMVESVEGKHFEVDISDEACGKFGFKYGQRITIYEKGGIVVGVAPIDNSERKVLWIALDRDNGKVCFPFLHKDILPA